MNTYDTEQTTKPSTVSTIGTSDILPVARREIRKFTKGANEKIILPYMGSHITLDDLVMDTAEKVVRANPAFLTKAYVQLAARTVCIDKMSLLKLHWVPDRESGVLSIYDEGDTVTPLEEQLEGNAFSELEPLEDFLRSCCDNNQQELYDALLSGKMYVEIAEDLGVGLRTLERQVNELKWMFEYLLTEENPDSNPDSILFPK